MGRTFHLQPAAVLMAAIACGAPAAMPTPAHAQWWKTHDGCMVTEHRDGRGMQWIVNDGETWSYVGGKWNDKISSVICEVFCTLTVWEHSNYQGASKVFQNSPYVGGAWNDRISSMRAHCDAS